MENEEPAAKVLLLDGDAELKKSLFEAWSVPDTHLRESSGGQGALKTLSQGGFSVLFLGTDYLTIDNLDILDFAREHNPGIEIFVLAHVRDAQKAEQAVERGAHSYVIKPVGVKLLEALTRKALSRSLERRNVRELQEHVLEDMLGSSPSMKKILRTLLKVGPTNSTLLISGESGTGKEFVANIIHRLSNRSQENFVAVNCGAIPETLVESELFGSKKGSYTGSIADRKGLAEAADKGTLFLDEIGELSLQTQVKLLRFLQEKEIRRVGDTDTRVVDVRVIAATNKDLHKAIQDGSFREDLYYRLSIFHLTLPPLRERRNAIPGLIRSFVKKFAPTMDKEITGMAKSAEAALMNYDYPGNIRQLENIIEHAVTLCEGGMLRLEDLPEYLSGESAPPALFALPKTEVTVQEDPDTLITLQELERSYIHKALEVCHKNHTEAARRLGISRSTLWRKLKEHGMAEVVAGAV
jgi:DNA-binding NtrC family response regulator